MRKSTNSSATVISDNVSTIVVDEVSNSKKTKVQKPDVLENSANKLEEEENESPKKRDLFSNVKTDVFGFSKFDDDNASIPELAAKLAAGEITLTDFNKAISGERKSINSSNQDKENLTFEEVCGKISDSKYFADFANYVTKDLLSTKSLLIDNDKVVIYHGSQSEDNEKFVADKVTIKGAHKPYSDIIYKSFADITTSNILKAFSNYSYYKNSLKRCKKQKKQETDNVSYFIKVAAILKVNFGYSIDELTSLLSSPEFETACKELKKKK